MKFVIWNLKFNIMSLFISLFSNAGALILADYLLANFVFTGNILDLFLASFIFSLINFFLKPVLKILMGPLLILSLGLFSLIINMGLLWLLDYLVKEITITGISTYFWATLIISLVNLFVNLTIRADS